jgi:hypothetical protein
LPSPYENPTEGLDFNVLLAVEDSLVLLVGSQTLNKLFIFDYDFGYYYPPNQVSLPQPPIKFLSLGGRRVMILYRNTQGPQIYETKRNLQVNHISDLQNPNSLNRYMDAAVLNDPITNKNEPVIALFYNENKVDIIKEEDFTLKNTLVISEWSDESASNKEGFIILLPYSDFLVVAKEGESKVIFKNYMKIG